MKEVNLKVYIFYDFQLYDILGNAKPWRQQKDGWLLGVGMAGRDEYSEHKEFLGQSQYL